MNIFESTGESSCKGRENGDASTGSERPLKKARFAWQVKGKYHLKNETDESNKSLAATHKQPSTSEPSSTSQSSSNTFESGLGDCLIKHNYSKLDSVTNSDNSSLTPNNNVTKEQLNYPRYISSYERTSSNMLRSNSIKTVSMADNVEDQCVAQWQARQIVKGCLDNTLNRVLESWTTDPLPGEEANSRFLALDFAEFINHLPGDNSVENEGILMAISAHGLQNAGDSSSSDANNAESFSTLSSTAFDIPSPLRSLSPMASDDDSQHSNNQQCATKEEPIKVEEWQCDTQNANYATPFAYYTEPSQTYDFYDVNNQNSNTDSLEIDSQFDFMNAAVLYAIKSKGLTASGTEYG